MRFNIGLEKFAEDMEIDVAHVRGFKHISGEPGLVFGRNLQFLADCRNSRGAMMAFGMIALVVLQSRRWV
jgi:hypothetical protein